MSWLSSLVLVIGFAAFSDAEELVINPVPRALITQETASITFEKGLAGFRALNQCQIAVEEGILVVSSEGEDPYIARRCDLAGERFRITIRLKTYEPGQVGIYWSSGQEPGFSGGRHQHQALVPDGEWHQYEFDIKAAGGLKELRIDPGTRPGRYEIQSVEIRGYTLHPLEIDRVRLVERGLEFRVWNRGNEPVVCRWRNQERRLAPGENWEVLEPVQGGQILEKIVASFQCDGLPPVERICFLYHDDVPARWIRLSGEPKGELCVEVCPEGNAARFRMGDVTVAAIAPIVVPADPLGPGLFRSVPPLELVEHQGNTCLLKGKDLWVWLSLREEELYVEAETQRAEVFGKQEPAQPTEEGEILAEIEGPVVRVFGPLQQGLFAGLEYLGKGEPSSSRADIETEEHIRFAPDRLKVTMPLMAFVTPKASVAMTWEDMRLQPIYATPNFFDGTPEHRMSLRGKSVQAIIRVKPGRLEDSILWVVRKHGLPPLPQPPRSQEEQDRLCLWALTEGPLRDSNGWGHCVEPNWTRQFYVDMVSTIWHLSGKLPEVSHLVPNGAHIANETAWLLTGRAQEWLAHLRARTQQLLKSQEADGSFRYRGKFARGHYEDTASGHCARPAALLLEAAYYLGDEKALQAGLKTLEYMKRFCVPRGAQTWELSLHTPDILAAAELVRAYVRGYELTGKEEYLAEARRWALSGIPFVYLWGEFPVMLYATIPVYGATHWKAPNWMGLPVQWCGIVYAYAVNRLAEYDATVDWRHLAWGILIAAQQMQVPPEGGPNAGLLPDGFHLRNQRRLGPFINPCAIVSLDRAIRGEIHRPVVATGDGRRVVSPFPVRIENGKAIVEGRPGVRYQLLVDGNRVIDVVSEGRDIVDLSGE